MDKLINTLNNLSLNKNDEYISKIVLIQKYFRGYLTRCHLLPLILYRIQSYIKSSAFKFCNNNDDGRINSCMDEDEVIKLLQNSHFGDKIKKPQIRMWYDILAFDTFYGWLPINIKTSTLKQSDNIGNLATCVYAYTDEVLDIHRHKTYENGKMSELLFEKLRDKQYNKCKKKDYYFVGLNKNDSSDVIINSIKGLNMLTPNANNLPFQINWSRNRNFVYKNINNTIQLFITCLQYTKPCWKESFMKNIRTL
jgi:hypothetical protein